MRYVAQFYDEGEERWRDVIFRSDPNHPSLDSEAKWAAVSKTLTGKWRVIQRTEKIIREGVEND